MVTFEANVCRFIPYLIILYAEECASEPQLWQRGPKVVHEFLHFEIQPQTLIILGMHSHLSRHAVAKLRVIPEWFWPKFVGWLCFLKELEFEAESEQLNSSTNYYCKKYIYSMIQSACPGSTYIEPPSNVVPSIIYRFPVLAQAPKI